jgi:hypothetical protein
MQKSPENSAGPSDTYVKAKTMKFFGFATEIIEIQDFLANYQRKSSLHCFFALIFILFSVKAMEANSGCDEEIKC